MWCLTSELQGPHLQGHVWACGALGAGHWLLPVHSAHCDRCAVLCYSPSRCSYVKMDSFTPEPLALANGAWQPQWLVTTRSLWSHFLLTDVYGSDCSSGLAVPHLPLATVSLGGLHTAW